MKIKFSFAGIALAVALPAFSNNIVNPSFETGDFTGWNSDSASVVTSYTAQNSTVYNAVSGDGNDFALLSGHDFGAPSLLGLSQSDFNPYNPGPLYGYNGGAAIAQNVNVNAGDTLTFQYLFYSDDYYPFTDSAFFVAGGAITLLASIESVGGQDHSTGWQSISWTAPSSGNYNIGFIELNGGDNVYDSHLAVDSAVPAPQSLMLLGTAVLGMALYIRRRQKARVSEI